ncbi:hypothetical protein K466DRAFT_220699 [Polyporus arcularius HHB13444]|uniref:Uncharacterized protein n=1 Tax=Polyporus arcularius HHB13444 TaxID=1314778 RepID=A0A5C3P4J8_9APHY|nr:hypothetical protein K466DRAFT_220699 [Polyporus arcularius HHB13444]
MRSRPPFRDFQHALPGIPGCGMCLSCPCSAASYDRRCDAWLLSIQCRMWARPRCNGRISMLASYKFMTSV